MNFSIKLRYGITITLVVAIGACLSSCAGVTFYSDASLKTKTGIPIFAPKPYILVARTGAQDKPVEVSIVYLNDPQKIIYAVPCAGLGSNKMILSLANGQMTSFGHETDTKIPELITSLSGLITARAAALKTEAEAAEIRAGIETEQAGESTIKQGKDITAIAEDMSVKIAAGELAGLTDDELTTVRSAAQALKQAGTALSDPANVGTASQYLQTIETQIEALRKLLASHQTDTSRNKPLQLVGTWTGDLSAILASSQAGKEVVPNFELYEIIQVPGSQTTLHRVTP